MRTVSTLLAGLLVLGSAPPVRPLTPPRREPRARTSLKVDPAWLAKHLEDKDLILLHVGRDPAGYARGHLPGARFVEFGKLVAVRDGLPNEMPPVDELTSLARGLGLEHGFRIVVYDEDKGLLAARAFVVLDYLGLGARAALLDGQLPLWKKGGRPLSAARPRIVESGFVPRLDPRVLVDLRTVRDLVWQLNAAPGAAVSVIDARPAEQFAGQDPGEGISRPGHIAGAASVPWEGHLRGPEDARLRSLDELRALYRPAVPRPEGPVVTYCRTGVQASHSYYVLKYLGYDPLLFDGSYIAWSARPDAPIGHGKPAR